MDSAPCVSCLINLSLRIKLLFLIDEPPQLQARLQADGDLCQHVGHFLLHQLIPCQWHAKLDSGLENNTVLSLMFINE